MIAAPPGALITIPSTWQEWAIIRQDRIYQPGEWSSKLQVSFMVLGQGA